MGFHLLSRFFLAAVLIGIFPPAGTLLAGSPPCVEPSEGTAAIPDVDLKEIARGFREPVHLTPSGDGSGRLFVVEQGGAIRIVEGEKLLPDPFLDLQDRMEEIDLIVRGEITDGT